MKFLTDLPKSHGPRRDWATILRPLVKRPGQWAAFPELEFGSDRTRNATTQAIKQGRIGREALNGNGGRFEACVRQSVIHVRYVED